ncbi:MAG: FGGY-family carbohydrate kinase, partial [Sphaerochaetaceae bacterium]
MLVGLDVGTTGVKSVVFDDCGTVLSSAFEEYPVDTGPEGKAQQNAEAVWKSTRSVLVRSILSCGIRMIKAIGLSVQGDAVIPVDANGNALAPALLGMDYRSAKAADEFSGMFGEKYLFRKTGMRPHAMNTITKIRYFKTIEPEIFEKAAAFVTYAEFISMKLGGERVLDDSMASRTMAYDLEKSSWDSQLLTFAGVDERRMGKVRSSGTIIGILDSAIAHEAGLSGSTMLCTGGHDQCCAALGAGVIKPGSAVVSTGTAEVLSTCLDTVKVNDQMYNSYYPCYRHVVPDKYFTFSLNHIGGILLRWFKDTVCGREIEAAKAANMDIYHYLDTHMDKEPSDLFILPHFNGTGTPWCDMNAKGAIIGLTLSTGVGQLYRSLLESQTYELALNLEALSDAGIDIHTISACGGGARSAQWLQIKSDILNRPIQVPACNESAALGAAILAGTAIK